MSMDVTFTPDEVAEMWKLDGGATYVRERCRGENPDWPHVRLSERVIRFTPAQLQQILDQKTKKPHEPIEQAHPFGLVTKKRGA